MPFTLLPNYGKCPDFQPDGSRDVAAQVHGDIAAAVKKDWSNFIASRGIESAMSAGGIQLTGSAVGGVASASPSNHYGIIFLGVS